MTTTNHESATTIVGEVSVNVKRESSVLGIRNDCGKQEDAVLLTTVGKWDHGFFVNFQVSLLAFLEIIISQQWISYVSPLANYLLEKMPEN